MKPFLTAVGLVAATTINSPVVAAETKPGVEIHHAQPELGLVIASLDAYRAYDAWEGSPEIVLPWAGGIPPECKKRGPVPEVCKRVSADSSALAADSEPGDPVLPLPAPLPY